ncbi:uncharacterized protein LOC130591188 [Beta vulgaris subsp. vulgaris]|uniref:uncharacterized protein LOC130591188 n=1 Tax=Beta vulgaris subsp. vulgaris TaxID=3555 RepID=UPI0025470825|nr:uncharacterized protein LOC130591188 [Beta vulgaris subsp. vulgaris]
MAKEPNISHLKVFGCAVYVPIAPPHRSKMGPQRRGENKQLEKEISWNELSLSHLDPRNKQCELEVQKIIHLQSLANRLPDAFTDPNRVTKSHIPAVNAPIKIDVPEGKHQTASESTARLKRGRPIGSKDKNPRKRKGAGIDNGQTEETKNFEGSPGETLDMAKEEIQVPDNEEISTDYVMSGIKWNRNKSTSMKFLHAM